MEIKRRDLVAAAAWSMPVITAATALPAFAASTALMRVIWYPNNVTTAAFPTPDNGIQSGNARQAAFSVGLKNVGPVPIPAGQALRASIVPTTTSTALRMNQASTVETNTGAASGTVPSTVSANSWPTSSPYATSGNTYQYTYKTASAIPVGYTHWYSWYVQEVTATNLGATTASIVVELTESTVALEDSVTQWAHSQFVRPGTEFVANPATSA